MQRESKAQHVARSVATTVAKVSAQQVKRQATADRLAEHERATKQVAVCPRFDILEGGHV
jgi:hypothetical protein